MAFNRHAMSDRYLDILQQYWHYPDFRGIQRQIIESIGSGHDTLGLMPTGGGKSITFQVPALADEGLCLVVTPLIALMKDQVDHLRDRGIRAACVHADMSRDEMRRTLDNCIYGGYKFLYVSPERLQSENFLAQVVSMPVRYLVVDEAHCISQWGYDFRPAYMHIATLRRRLSKRVPVLALTATATPRVVDDICRRLDFAPDAAVFRMSFARENLGYHVIRTEEKPRTVLHLLRQSSGSSIVYARKREYTEDLAKWLTANGIEAMHYHAGLRPVDKDVRRELWQQGRVRVMVATNAFGMGIDKPDVRTVIHVDSPDAIEAYFQEAGRAGRDGKPADAYLLFSARDEVALKRHVDNAFPSKDYIRRVYDDLACYFCMGMGDGYGVRREFSIEQFCYDFHYFPYQLTSALNLLTRTGVILYADRDDNASRVMFLMNREQLYTLQHLTPFNERLLHALMRHYTGLFTEYVYIDEHAIALTMHEDDEAVYDALKALGRAGIIHYVPRKNVPHITYTIPRVGSDEIRITPDIYEDRRAEMAERVEGMLAYAKADDCCRSQALLAYFGETDAPPCGRCDVCQSRAQSESGASLSDDSERAACAIAKLLDDGRDHDPSELLSLPFAPDTVSAALRWLVDEGEVELCDNRVRLA